MSFLILSIGNEVNIQHRCQYRYDSFLIYIKDMIIQLISCFHHGFPCLNGLTDILSVWHQLNFWFLFFQSRNVNRNFTTVEIRWAELCFPWKHMIRNYGTTSISIYYTEFSVLTLSHKTLSNVPNTSKFCSRISQ